MAEIKYDIQETVGNVQGILGEINVIYFPQNIGRGEVEYRVCSGNIRKIYRNSWFLELDSQ